MIISISTPFSPLPPFLFSSHYLSLSQVRELMFLLALSLPPYSAYRLLPASSRPFLGPVTSPEFTFGLGHSYNAQFQVSSDSCWQCLTSSYSMILSAFAPGPFEEWYKLSSAWKCKGPVLLAEATFSWWGLKLMENCPASCPSDRQFSEESSQVLLSEGFKLRHRPVS